MRVRASTEISSLFAKLNFLQRVFIRALPQSARLPTCRHFSKRRETKGRLRLHRQGREQDRRSPVEEHLFLLREQFIVQLRQAHFVYKAVIDDRIALVLRIELRKAAALE